MSENKLRKNFLNLISKYSDDENYNVNCWAEVKNQYSSENRHYHNLDHLLNMLIEFYEVRDRINKPDVVLFAIFYHDIIYHPSKSDNEHKSALFFKRTISLTKFPLIEECIKMIEHSKDHETSSNPDCNYFLDIDLSVLGKERKQYIEYCKNIRKEFFAIPDDVYEKERRNVLTKFLKRNRIFNSVYFFDKYEDKARENIQFELEFIL